MNTRNNHPVNSIVNRIESSTQKKKRSSRSCRRVTWFAVVICLLIYRVPLSAQDTHLNSLELISQLYTMPKNIRRQGELNLGRFHGHGAMDTNAHYQGIIRHKEAIYLTSSYPNDPRGGRLLVLNSNQVVVQPTPPLDRVFPPIRFSMQPTATSEFWDWERADNRRPEHLYWHYGGMDISGDVMAVAVEYTHVTRVPRSQEELNLIPAFLRNHPMFAFKEVKTEKGAVLFFDVSEPLKPRLMRGSTFAPEYLKKSGAVGLTRYVDGTWCLAVTGGSEGKVRLYEATREEGEDFEFEHAVTYTDSKSSVYQAMSLVTTADDSVFLLGTYNDEYAVDDISVGGKKLNGIPIGTNKVALTWLHGHKYRGQHWRPVILDSMEFDLWAGYDSIAEASGGVSLGSIVIGIFAAPVIGPAALAIPAASSLVTYSQVKKDFEHPNFDGGGGILIDEKGNLEIWASAHGRGGGKSQKPRFSTSW